MNTLLKTPAEVIAHLQTVLPTQPSAGLQRLITEVMAQGLPLQLQTRTGSPVGDVQLSPEHIVVSLADVALDEGVVANPLARALCEQRGWPIVFAAEAADSWVGRVQATLTALFENVGAVGVQKEYGIDFAAHENALLARQDAAVQELHKHAATFETMELTGEQEVEFGIGLALQTLERFWRTGAVPADWWNALAMIPGAKALFDSLNEFVTGPVPTTGWENRRLMGACVERLDDYMEIKGNVRPFMVLTHFVPALHPEDEQQALGNVARLVMVPLQSEVAGEHSILILPHRDGLPFGFRHVLADDSAVAEFGDRILHARYGDFCRTLLPAAFAIRQPTGESTIVRVPAASVN